MLSSPSDCMVCGTGVFIDMSTENAEVGFWAYWIIPNNTIQLRRRCVLSYWHGHRCENGEHLENFLRFVG